ncbi:GNAT family N-acetyltransferase [Halobacteria archaeon HArc-gm2]|nr:GNAT family N-acetyltransferase [Halobacteria archaeon HArc-gm2]
MEIRTATGNDDEDIAQAARASLSESYSHFVDEETIDEMVEQWYASERIRELLDDDHVVFDVVEVDDEVVGFAQGATVETEPVVGEIHWLHVVPGEREEGIGVQLLGHVQETFEDSEAAVLRGLVLEGNEAGTGFYTDHGFERAEATTIEIGDQEFDEVVFEKQLDDEPTEQVLEGVAGPDDRELFVNFSEGERGLRAPFYPVFGTRKLSERYGWFCGDCDSIDNTMDSMGRIVCNNCGNKRKATRWDASYL